MLVTQMLLSNRVLLYYFLILLLLLRLKANAEVSTLNAQQGRRNHEALLAEREK